MKCLAIAKGDVNEAIQLLLETDDEARIDYLDHSPCVDSVSAKVMQCVQCMPKFLTLKS